MALLDDVHGHVSAAKEPLDQAAASIAAAHEHADRLATGSAARGYKTKAAQAGQIRDALGELHTVMVDSSATVDEIRAKLEELRGLLRRRGAARPPSATPVTVVPLADFHPRRPAPGGVAAVKRLGWPRNREGKISARGLLYGTDGKPLISQPLRATRDGPGADTSDLAEPWRSDERYTPRWHIEGHTAAWMRHRGVTEAVLYLNTPPCGGPPPGGEPDPLRCEANLPALLPRGTVLHLHSVDERGRTRSKSYTGTGEALIDD